MKRPVLYKLIYPAGFGEVPISELSPSVYLPDRFFHALSQYLQQVSPQYPVCEPCFSRPFQFVNFT